MYVCVYVCMCVCMCMYVYVNMHVHVTIHEFDSRLTSTDAAPVLKLLLLLLLLLEWLGLEWGRMVFSPLRTAARVSCICWAPVSCVVWYVGCQHVGNGVNLVIIISKTKMLTWCWCGVVWCVWVMWVRVVVLGWYGMGWYVVWGMRVCVSVGVVCGMRYEWVC
jgi:hypothetical protein